jgi:ADP-heptose:LPS heptosyltransferase
MSRVTGPVLVGRGMAAAVAALARHGAPQVLLRFGRSPGDTMLCTAVLHELRKRGETGLWMESNLPPLFLGSPDVDVVIPYGRRVRRLLKWAGGRPVFPAYDPWDSETDLSPGPDGHIISCMCRHVLTGEVSLRPYLHLDEEEKHAAEFATGAVVIQSSGLSAAQTMANKNWGAGRMQEVARLLGANHRLIQIGGAGDPLLDGVADHRGLPLRPCAGILSRAACFVGLAGFFMHLSRAVECRSVIVYGGREAPWQSGYIANENLASDIECAPCWQRNRCDHDRRCMTEIMPLDVSQAVERQLGRAGQPLPVATDVI